MNESLMRMKDAILKSYKVSTYRTFYQGKELETVKKKSSDFKVYIVKQYKQIEGKKEIEKSSLDGMLQTMTKIADVMTNE